MQGERTLQIRYDGHQEWWQPWVDAPLIFVAIWSRDHACTETEAERTDNSNEILQRAHRHGRQTHSVLHDLLPLGTQDKKGVQSIDLNQLVL